MFCRTCTTRIVNRRNKNSHDVCRVKPIIRYCVNEVNFFYLEVRTLFFIVPQTLLLHKEFSEITLYFCISMHLQNKLERINALQKTICYVPADSTHNILFTALVPKCLVFTQTTNRIPSLITRRYHSKLCATLHITIKTTFIFLPLFLRRHFSTRQIKQGPLRYAAVRFYCYIVEFMKNKHYIWQGISSHTQNPNHHNESN
jgi:hypothetical protein